VDRRQLRVPPRRQLGRFHQCRLQVRVALFGNRPAVLFARRTVQRRSKPAVTDRLRDRAKALRGWRFNGNGYSSLMKKAQETVIWGDRSNGETATRTVFRISGYFRPDCFLPCVSRQTSAEYYHRTFKNWKSRFNC
jgi:hypothetical protein